MPIAWRIVATYRFADRRSGGTATRTVGPSRRVPHALAEFLLRQSRLGEPFSDGRHHGVLNFVFPFGDKSRLFPKFCQDVIDTTSVGQYDIDRHEGKAMTDWKLLGPGTTGNALGCDGEDRATRGKVGCSEPVGRREEIHRQSRRAVAVLHMPRFRDARAHVQAHFRGANRASARIVRRWQRANHPKR